LRVALHILAASFIAIGLTLFTSPALAAEYNVGDPCPAGFPDGMKHQKDDGSGNGLTLVCDGGTFVLNTEITGTKTLLQIGNDPNACTSDKEGRLRYDPGGDTWEYCDSAGNWRPFGYCSSNLSTGLVGHWPLDDGSGTTATDVSGNGNNGTLQNMDPATDWVTGVIGSHALDFDGVDDELGVIYNPTFVRDISVAAWIRLRDQDLSSAQSLVIISENLKPYDFALVERFGGAQLGFEVWVGGSRFKKQDPGAIPRSRFGEWIHVAAVREADEIRLYVDGTDTGGSYPDPQTDGDLDATGSDLFLGSRNSANNVFDGQLDNIRIYNRALSDCEVQALYLGL
jgi:hypothetical protein